MEGKGYLRVQTTTAEGALPVANALVRIGNDEELYSLRTDVDGVTETVSLAAPDPALSLDQAHQLPAYATYSVVVEAEGYETSIIRGVQIFANETSTLPVTMIPLSAGEPDTVITDIPENALDTTPESLPEGTNKAGRVLRDVIIPEFIVVHLGTPSSSARNVRVKFIDYIKNVASSEIYPTWPESALYANIHAQVSFALNRIYTEWYTSRGYNFNITNSTAYDQSFVEGRNIFDSISRVVDRIFNLYVKKTNSVAPFFTQYCNGTTVTCKGLSQWGTVDLAKAGKTPIEILKYYYGNDIELALAVIVNGAPESFPGYTLEEGDSNVSVRIIQSQLNRIRQNYPSIPRILIADGDYKSDTTAAVKEFQRIFSLPQTGNVDKGTWYKISYIYVAVKKLADLASEAETEITGTKPPTTVIRQGSTGPLVNDLQVLLGVIGDFYSSVPRVNKNGIFDAVTKNAVVEFQKTFGLTQDGVVGPATWNKLYSVYNGIKSNVENTTYPGTALRVGSVGESVRLMQTYLNAISNRYPTIGKVSEDGKFGAQTEAAVKAFQKIFGLTVDGVVGRQTWDKIVSVYKSQTIPYPGTALRVGSRGDNVLLIQGRLNKIAQKYPSIPVVSQDGSFGPKTQEAVIAFQRLFGLSPDGVVGKQTWDKIMEKSA